MCCCVYVYFKLPVPVITFYFQMGNIGSDCYQVIRMTSDTKNNKIVQVHIRGPSVLEYLYY